MVVVMRKVCPIRSVPGKPIPSIRTSALSSNVDVPGAPVHPTARGIACWTILAAMKRLWLGLIAVASACSTSASKLDSVATGAGSAVAAQDAGTAPSRGTPRTPRKPLTLTYLGVAGWQITDGTTTVLVDPYFSRPTLDAAMASDPAAVAKHAPAKADLVVVGHSHVDHLLDAPAVALKSGAQIMGSISTTRYARAVGMPEDRVIPVQGGEDYDFGAVSVRVLPSLHSALDEKHWDGQRTEIAADPKLPLTFDGFAAGGTFGYLIRIGGHEVLVLSTANYIERELVGLTPDIAIVATGLRQELYDYSCRLMRATGSPAHVLTTHFDAWREPLEPTPPLDAETRADLAAFEAEIHACAPSTVVTTPERWKPIVIE